MVQEISNCIVCVCSFCFVCLFVCLLLIFFKHWRLKLLRWPCWMSRWSPTIVKFIDLFHLCPWPKTIIERPYIVRLNTLFPLLKDLVQNISLFPLFSMVLTAILDSNLEFYGQHSLKHNKYLSIRFALSKLAENDTSFVSTTHLIQEISVFVFFSIWRR